MCCYPPWWINIFLCVHVFPTWQHKVCVIVVSAIGQIYFFSNFPLHDIKRIDCSHYNSWTPSLKFEIPLWRIKIHFLILWFTSNHSKQKVHWAKSNCYLIFDISITVNLVASLKLSEYKQYKINKMDFKRTFNSTTMYGRRNVALATLGSVATFILYKKIAGSGKASFYFLYQYRYTIYKWSPHCIMLQP